MNDTKVKTRKYTNTFDSFSTKTSMTVISTIISLPKKNIDNTFFTFGTKPMYFANTQYKLRKSTKVVPSTYECTILIRMAKDLFKKYINNPQINSR